MALIRKTRPDLAVALDVYGRGDARTAWVSRAEALGLRDAVRFHGRIPIEDVPAALASADIGLAPTRRSDFTDYSLSTKIFEYGAMGKPAIASRLPLVQQTFSEGSVATYEPGDPADLAAVVMRLVDEPLEREARIEHTATRVRELSWANESARYIDLIEGLIRARVGDRPARRWPLPRELPESESAGTERAGSNPAAVYAGRP